MRGRGRDQINFLTAPHPDFIYPFGIEGAASNLARVQSTWVRSACERDFVTPMEPRLVECGVQSSRDSSKRQRYGIQVKSQGGNL